MNKTGAALVVDDYLRPSLTCKLTASMAQQVARQHPAPSVPTALSFSKQIAGRVPVSNTHD